MSELRVAIVPVGRMDLAEVEDVAARVSKVIHRAVEIREPLALPKGAEDATRGQYRAGALLSEGRLALARLKAVRLAGGAASGSPVATEHPDATILVTDVDLFTATTDSVTTEADAAHRIAVVSVRRMREAFYRRKADPLRQKARLAKEILRLVGRLHGLPECRDAGCAMAPTGALADIDRKSERYCAACWKRLSTGAMRI